MANIDDILSNDVYAEEVAAALRGESRGGSHHHARDAARELQDEGKADEFLRQYDESR